jgi:hypothetical protein
MLLFLAKNSKYDKNIDKNIKNDNNKNINLFWVLNNYLYNKPFFTNFTTASFVVLESLSILNFKTSFHVSSSMSSINFLTKLMTVNYY